MEAFEFRRPRCEREAPYIKPENIILSLNSEAIEMRFNGSCVVLRSFDSAAASLLQVHLAPAEELTHKPKYPARTVICASLTKGTNMEVRFLLIPMLPAVLESWYDRDIR